MEVSSLSSEHFLAKDVKQLLGIDKNKLFYWIRTYRLLKPDIQEASGTGTRSKFSLKNLLELMIINQLLILGMELKYLKNIKGFIDDQVIFQKDEKNVEVEYIYEENKKKRKGGRDIYDFALFCNIPIGIRYHVGTEGIYFPEIWTFRPEQHDVHQPFPVIYINFSGTAEDLKERIKKR
jgi:DNA-binding transcriptional MerR regulator